MCMDENLAPQLHSLLTDVLSMFWRLKYPQQSALSDADLRDSFDRVVAFVEEANDALPKVRRTPISGQVQASLERGGLAAAEFVPNPVRRGSLLLYGTRHPGNTPSFGGNAAGGGRGVIRTGLEQGNSLEGREIRLPGRDDK